MWLRPDRTILFVRNPNDNYASLQCKPYANKGGSLNSKFRILDSLFQSREQNFDLTIHYEEMIQSPDRTLTQLRALGWELGSEAYQLSRSLEEVRSFNREHSLWCREHDAHVTGMPGWGNGNISGTAIRTDLVNRPVDPRLAGRVTQLCPNLCRHYQLPPVSTGSRGVTYVAWGRCIADAERSAETARRFGLKTCLLAPDYSGSSFDVFLPVELPLRFPTDKVFVYNRSPWDTTLFLDTDTLIFGDLDFGFEMAERHGMAAGLAFSNSIPAVWGLPVDPDIVQYNGGVLFVHRHHPAMKNLWEQLGEEILQQVPDLATRTDNPRFNDQAGLALLLFQQRFAPYVLPPNWNLRPQLGMRNGHGPIKIWHSREAPVEPFDPTETKHWMLDAGGMTPLAPPQQLELLRQNLGKARLNQERTKKRVQQLLARVERQSKALQISRGRQTVLRERLHEFVSQQMEGRKAPVAGSSARRPKIFGIGLPRTGTSTLAASLRMLGYLHGAPPLLAGHSPEVPVEVHRLELTRAYFAGDWEPIWKIVDAFESFDDWPWPLLYREIAQRYPDSRFILTLRSSPERWLDSLRSHAQRSGPTPFRQMIFGHDMPDDDPQAHLSYYLRHNQQVQEFFAEQPERLKVLCWETGDGWTELCTFLKEEKPDRPFPHLNRSHPRSKPEPAKVCLVVGNNRSFSTLTASLLSLHPQCATLNHGWPRVMGNPEWNFFECPENLDKFVAFALDQQGSGRKGSWGGSILHSHAMQRAPIREAYLARHESSIDRDTLRCLVWKDAQKIADYFVQNPGRLAGLPDRVCFVAPMRNPLDIACSLLERKAAREARKAGEAPSGPAECDFDSFCGTLRRVLSRLLWVADTAASLPDRCRILWPEDYNGASFASLAQWLGLTRDEPWLSDVARLGILDASPRRFTKEQVAFYLQELHQCFSRHPEMQLRLAGFAAPKPL